MGGPRESAVFAKGLDRPFGIAFYPAGAEPRWLYVANTDSVVRFPYRVGDRAARGPAEKVVAELPGGGLLRGGGHWTRDIAFSLDGKKMWVSVGSRSNNDDTDGNSAERDRADILEFDPDGGGRRVYASGIRNAVGISVHPTSGELWASVNERDELGDNLVPDYLTHVQEGGFYGWPWFYMGGQWDPRHRGKHPELARQGDHAGRPPSAARRLVADDVLRAAGSFPKAIGATSSRPSTAHGIGPRAPGTKSFACRCTARRVRRASTRIS